MYEIEDKMTEAGFDKQRVKEAQVLYVLALSDCSGRSGFVQKLVGCFAEGQSDSQLIAVAIANRAARRLHVAADLQLSHRLFLHVTALDHLNPGYAPCRHRQ